MSTNPLKNNVKEAFLNSQNLGDTTKILNNLFKTYSDSTSTKVSIMDLFQNPNLMLQTLQTNCSSVANLFTTANTAMSGADTFTYEVSSGVMETASTGLGDVNTNEILSNIMAQTQSTIMNTCKLVADKALMINNLSSQLDSIKSAMSSGDINNLTKVYEQLTNSMNELIQKGDLNG